MRKVLIFGGTRFFGKRLVQLLIENGDQVTIATRGITPDPFGDQVKRIALDRTSFESMKQGLGVESWDLVYDQMCYSPNDALYACELLKNRTSKYVLTSSQSAYLEDGFWKEIDFNPFTEPYRLGSAQDFEYGWCKRYAECVFYQNASFPVSSVRFPIVFGEDDYKGRLEFHVRKVLSGEPHVVPNSEASTGFIHAQDAAKFLFWLGSQPVTGPLNAASAEPISISHLIKKIGFAAGRAALIYESGDPEHRSPLVDDESSYLDVRRAQSLGFEFMPLETWLDPLIDFYVARERGLLGLGVR